MIPTILETKGATALKSKGREPTNKTPAGKVARIRQLRYEGMSYRGIGAACGVSEHTAARHSSDIKPKPRTPLESSEITQLLSDWGRNGR